MRTLKKIVSLAVLGSVMVSGGQASERETDSTGAPPAPPATSPIPREPAAPNDAERPSPDSAVNNPERKREKSELPDRPGREIAEKFAEEAKQARLEFLKQKQDLKKRVIEAERDQIRAKLRENRPAAAALQTEVQQDFLQRLAELKERLNDHKEVLEAAKSDAKDKGKKRKIGD